MAVLEVRKSKDGTYYVWFGNFNERIYPKQVGFKWNPDGRFWYTSDPEKAVKLVNFATPETKQDILQALERKKKEIESINILYPEGLQPFPYQIEGARRIVLGKPLLLADDMGLGKTVQVLLAVNSDPNINHVLVISPASVKVNWVKEAKRWLTRPFEVTYLSGKKPEPIHLSPNHLVVINYDIVSQWLEVLSQREWDLLVLDEAHYLKNPKAQRTIAIVGTKERPSPLRAKRKVALTGTPILNRPVEIWPVLSWLDPKHWGNFWAFANRYCGAEHNGFGWDFSGATNLEELNERLRRTVMLRRSKAEVLKDLPPKVRQILELSPDRSDQSLVQKEKDLYDQWQEKLTELKVNQLLAKVDSDEDFAHALRELEHEVHVLFEEMAITRHEVARAKVPYAVEHLKNVLESKQKVVVWVHHRDVGHEIKRALQEFGPVMVLGGASAEERAEAVRKFQEDKSTRVFIGGITASAEGITLTASDLAVFVELDWRPGKLLQAEDRIHRIGQTNNVLIQYLVFENSLDSHMAQKLAWKMDTIAKAIGNSSNPTPEEEVPLPPDLGSEDYEQTAERIRRSKKEGSFTPQLSPVSVSFIHTCLRAIASLDRDRATVRNEIGFNRFDSHLGHKLANLAHLSEGQALLGLKLIRKYRRQLSHLGLLSSVPPELMPLLTPSE